MERPLYDACLPIQAATGEASYVLILSSSTAGTGSSSAEVAGNQEESHFCKNGYSADTSTKATAPETARRQETELTSICRNLGVWSNLTAVESYIGGTTMTMSATIAALPLSLARTLVIPLSPAPVVIANSISAAPTRKRKRILGEYIRVHTGDKPYVCGGLGCSKRYSSRAATRFHRTPHAPSFTAEQSLDGSIHIGTDANSVQVRNSQTLRYVCSECGKRFRVRELLMAHLKVHATHRAAAFTSLAPSGSAETVIDPPQSMEEETSEKSSHSIVIPPPNDSMYLWDTIRAQQNQIEQLKEDIAIAWANFH
ncbi:unnamed protein product [Peronospora destructor]|uniref:C2H2-type domain-containing protein n=1 Tax=Peronospora destructor TaxID=86335 RepID=A0AAV0VA82_9STRA|nr:unnamed protein product [Peronospora destructor]